MAEKAAVTIWAARKFSNCWEVLPHEVQMLGRICFSGEQGRPTAVFKTGQTGKTREEAIRKKCAQLRKEIREREEDIEQLQRMRADAP